MKFQDSRIGRPTAEAGVCKVAEVCENRPGEKNVPATKLILENQAYHALWLAALLTVAAWLAPDLVSGGAYLGVSATIWFWAAIGSAVAHQGWVLLCWRLELHAGLLTRWFGSKGFALYGAGFAALSATRLCALIGLALADRGTVPADPVLLDVAATGLLAPIGYLFYSVGRYFTYQRALGADHFDPAYRSTPLERRGIFRFTRNGMYTFGMLLVWLPGLYAASQAALLAAAFNHAYIWVHYYCTELPDMRRIYGEKA